MKNTKSVIFEKVCRGHVVVYADDNEYGNLDFDGEQKAWVLWPDQICDGITCYEDLKESEDQIEFELEHAE